MLLVNCKNYLEVSGESLVMLAGAARELSARYHVTISLAPPPPMMALPLGVPLMAQHVDDALAGGTTGYVVPEVLHRMGVRGSIINHSEHRLEPERIRLLVERLRGVKMISVVCTRDVRETARYAALQPDYIAIEPPELIGTGRSVSTYRPELISGAANAIYGRTRLLCGAGIAAPGDVRKALELGAEGVLVASGIVKDADPASALERLAGAFSA